MGTTVVTVLLLGIVTVSRGVSSDGKRLLLSEPTHVENEIQQLKSLVATLQTTLTTKIAKLESDLTTANSKLSTVESELASTKSALSLANSNHASLEFRLNASESALASANSKLASLKSQGMPLVLVFCLKLITS